MDESHQKSQKTYISMNSSNTSSRIQDELRCTNPPISDNYVFDPDVQFSKDNSIHRRRRGQIDNENICSNVHPQTKSFVSSTIEDHCHILQNSGMQVNQEELCFAQSRQTSVTLLLDISNVINKKRYMKPRNLNRDFAATDHRLQGSNENLIDIFVDKDYDLETTHFETSENIEVELMMQNSGPSLSKYHRAHICIQPSIDDDTNESEHPVNEDFENNEVTQVHSIDDDDDFNFDHNSDHDGFSDRNQFTSMPSRYASTSQRFRYLSSDVMVVCPEYRSLGGPTEECPHCHARLWNEERVNGRSLNSKPEFSLCCSKGQISLQKVRPTP